ncbi:MAG: hypothetical protein LBC65_06610 [Oscillospiraceae bacterium]|jgi:hypothetical protein|nr:hypothetical protein [Oscillospiraceae bacterium]
MVETTVMTDFQFRSNIRMIRKMVEDKKARGATDDELIAYLDELLEEHNLPKRGSTGKTY